MFRSLRTRLILATVAIVVIAVGAVGFLSTRVSNQEFNRYVTSSRATGLSRFADTLEQHYRRNNWKDVQSVLERIGAITGKRLILVNQNNQLIAAWPDDLIGSSVQIGPNHSLIYESELRSGGHVVLNEVAVTNVPHLSILDEQKNAIGTLYATDPAFLQPDRETELFTFSVRRGVLLSVLGGALLAFLLTLAFSKRLLAPIENLTKAVRMLEKGDLQQRVPVQSADETGELAHAFNAMAESLQRLEQLRRNMVSDIAHELRTPLTNIRGQLESLQDGLAKPDTSAINSLHEEAMLLNGLIDDLQELALADAGHLRLSMEPLRIKNEMESVVKALQPSISKKNIEVVISVSQDLPVIHADIKRIGQTFRNLLTNALSHTQPGGRIVISARKAAKELEIAVTDNGEGIPSEDLPYIFERFFRSDRSRTRKTGGTGLGLAIVQQLVLAHNGKIQAESRVGEGTTIKFTLPLSPS